MKLTFIIPCFNAQKNLKLLCDSLISQKDPSWNAIFIDDMSTDETLAELREIASNDERFMIIENVERKFALRNIVETARELDDTIVAIIDGDDQLCNDDTVSLIKSAHDERNMVVWTGHRWDINNMNVSRELPEKVNPYQFGWCSSHLKTFDAELLRSIAESNFKDCYGRWFERGYDQALMLPLLFISARHRYVPDVCYLYKIESCSIENRDWTERKQLQTINFIRARGFLKN